MVVDLNNKDSVRELKGENLHNDFLGSRRLHQPREITS